MNNIIGIYGPTRQCTNCGKLFNLNTGHYIHHLWFCCVPCYNKYTKR